MTRRRKILVCGLCGVIAVGVVCFFCLRESEPSYNGRTLSEWLDRFESVDTDNDRLQAASAILAIGSNAAPFLVKWNGEHDSTFKSGCRNVMTTLQLRRLISAPVSKIAAINPTIRQLYARDGFEILQTNAISTLNGLSKQFVLFTDPDDVERTAYCIAQLGTEGLTTLISFADKPKSRVHYVCAVAGIVTASHYLGTNAEGAVPILANALQKDGIRVAAAGLGHIKSKPEISVPALASAVNSTNMEYRRDVLSALVKFGGAARSAVPALQLALRGSEQGWRESITNAIRKIAPDVLTNSASPVGK